MGSERRRVVDESSAGQFSEVEDRVLLCIYLLSDTTKPAKRELHDDWDSAHTWCSRYVHDGFTLGDGSAQDRYPPHQIYKIRCVPVKRVTEGFSENDTHENLDDRITHFEDKDGHRIDIWTMPV